MPITPDSKHLSLTLDRDILESATARHMKRMRIAVWLYLDLLGHLPEGEGSIEIVPAKVAAVMGLKEGTIRSWLGHLKQAGYVSVAGKNGSLRVTILRLREVPKPESPRFFTVAKLERALGETGHRDGLNAALDQYSDAVIKRALAGALAVPGEEIKKSRTALFIYLAKKYAQEN